MRTGNLLDIFQNSIFGTENRFRKADLGETKDSFGNPERGWFQIFPFHIGDPVEYETVKSCLLPEESLVLVIFDIGSYARGDLPGEAIEQMREILRFFDEQEKDVILRVVYDREGRAMEKEPALFGQVSRHMEQVAGLFSGSDVRVFIWQGLLVGNWGEMHGSRYLADNFICGLAETLRECTRDEMYFAVRTPSFLRKISGTGEKAAAAENFGLFDDAIMGSSTDCGTYSSKEAQRKEDISYAAGTALRVPFGGEVVEGERVDGRSYAERLSREEILRYLAAMHVTYLNRQHDVSVLERWRKEDIYGEVEARLGYRFRVTQVRAGVREVSGKKILVGKINIENSGFAPIYSETESYIVIRDASGETARVETSLNLQGKTGSDIGINVEMSVPGVRPVRFYLKTVRKRDGRIIRFANRQTQDGSVLLGEW